MPNTKGVPSDIEIAQKTVLKPIVEVASSIGIGEDELEYYGPYKAKVTRGLWERIKAGPTEADPRDGHNPDPAGRARRRPPSAWGRTLGNRQEGHDRLERTSLGPSFGVKGGAAGGGYSRCSPWRI